MAATWLSVMEAAARLKVTHQTIRNWLATGKPRGKKLPPFNLQVVSAGDVARVCQERVHA